ncbi:MAG: OmpA family protein [Gemmatimonadetes bacterium]|nr:OmpA family protein [Gemmatimonadota bacterium]
MSTKNLFTQLTAVALTLLLASSAAATGMSLDGVRGLLRVHSADPSTQGYVAGTVYGLYSQEFYPFQVSPRGQTEKVDFGAGMISFGYTPTPFVELSVRAITEAQWVDAYNVGNTGYEVGVGDVALHVKSLLTPATRKDWMLGAELSLATTTGNTSAFVGSWDRDGLDIGGRLNLTYANVNDMGESGMRFHANAGYLKRTSQFDEAVWAASAIGGTVPRSVLHGDQFQYGAALEVPVPKGWTFFTEWSGEYDMDASAAFGDNPMRVTPGFRWANTGGSFVWTTGYELSVASDEASPPWQWISGLSFGGYASPVSGSLLGVVRDADTGEVIEGAKIQVRNSEMGTETDASGHFRSSVPAGYAVLELSADGYNPKTRVIEMPGHDTVEFDFTMTKRNIYGSLRGRIRDAETGKPLFARVRVAGTDEWVETDPENGSYFLEQVPEGTTEIEFEASKYHTKMNRAKVVAGDIMAFDQSLEKDVQVAKGVLSGYVKDAKSGKAVPATITARGNGTMTATVDPATGLYELPLDEGTWSVSVVKPGYIAQVEEVQVSAKGASVRNFDLGELPKKMTLQGVFFDSGAATIKRESFSALADAAQFLINNDELAVVIEGHSDSQGSEASNVALSQRRADSVMKYLVVNHGLDPRRLKSKGVGPKEPVASNATAEGRALNRRIEFEILEGSAN